MNGFMIPPPYPFVEAWPRVFQSADRQQWLTPTMALRFDGGFGDFGGVSGAGARWEEHPTGATPSGGPPQVFDPAELLEADELGARTQDDEGDDGEYEYGFVLTDEWRERLVARASAARRPQHEGDSESAGDRRQSTARRKAQSAKKKQRKLPSGTRSRQLGPGAGNSRAEHLQRELADAKARELAMRWRIQRARGNQSPSAAVRRLEASLAARFDAFCDACEPVVWPHASAR